MPPLFENPGSAPGPTLLTEQNLQKIKYLERGNDQVFLVKSNPIQNILSIAKAILTCMHIARQYRLSIIYL